MVQVVVRIQIWPLGKRNNIPPVRISRSHTCWPQQSWVWARIKEMGKTTGQRPKGPCYGLVKHAGDQVRILPTSGYSFLRMHLPHFIHGDLRRGVCADPMYITIILLHQRKKSMYFYYQCISSPNSIIPTIMDPRCSISVVLHKWMRASSQKSRLQETVSRETLLKRA